LETLKSKNVSIGLRPTSEMEIKDRILHAAQELFYRYGLKSITMDDVCKQLSISKKTLYLHFTDKDDVIHCLLDRNLKQDCEEMAQIASQSKDAVMEIIALMKHIGDLFAKVNPSLFYDMQKYHPQAWRVFLEFKDKTMITMVEANLTKGKAQGLYRANLDVPTLAKMRMEQVSIALDPRIYPPDKFNISKVQMSLLEHFLYGIATLKGHRLINKNLQITEEE
jgi:AcrR family transcriptional regulator